MDKTKIAEIGQQIGTLASLVHDGNVDRIKAAVQRLTAAVTADLPDGSTITEADLIAHADQVIADARARRERINADE